MWETEPRTYAGALFLIRRRFTGRRSSGLSRQRDGLAQYAKFADVIGEDQHKSRIKLCGLGVG
jgi:hypothetical protein